MNYKRIQELEQKKKLDNEKFALFFETQGHQHIAENIFLHMDFEDLVALQNKKSGCELINKRSYDILNNPIFWLKKWTMNGLTRCSGSESLSWPKLQTKKWMFSNSSKWSFKEDISRICKLLG